MARSGSVKYQTVQLFEQTDIFQPGTSRDEMKAEIRAELAAEGLPATSQNIGERAEITSYGASKSYGDAWHQFAQWAKVNEGIRDIQQLNADIAQSYLEHRIEQGVKLSTYEKEASALSKMELALQKQAEVRGIEREGNLRPGIAETRETAKTSLEQNSETRAYERPEAIIAGLKDERHQLGSKLQLESGGRISEASQIRENQLGGLATDVHTGKQIGVINLVGGDTKGGHSHPISVTPQTYAQLENAIKNGPTITTKSGEGKAFKIEKTGYSQAVRGAAIASGQEPTGTHGLRHNFAQNRMQELQQNGKSFDAALKIVSQEMGHHRPSITLTYLR